MDKTTVIHSIQAYQMADKKTFYFTNEIYNISSSRMFRNIACFHNKKLMMMMIVVDVAGEEEIKK